MTEAIRLDFSATETIMDTKTRVFTGLAVPYGKTTIDGRNVQFAKGSLGDLESQSLTAVLVQHPFAKGQKAIHVGRVEAWIDSEHGLEFSARLNKSEAAEAIYQAMKNGEITDVSVGVYCSDFSEDEETGITTFNSASLLELSIITEGNGAFGESKILSVFHEQTDEEATSKTTTQIGENLMEENTTNEVADLRQDVEELSRSLSIFTEDRPSAVAPSKFTNFGQVVKAVAAGDPQAIKEMTEFAYTGAVSADVNIQHAWAKPLIDIVNLGRPVASLFDKQADPGKNTIEYLKLDSNTTQVAEQVNEGDDLAYGKLDLTSATTTMKTYGGYFDWSQQALDRSDVGVVDLGYKALAAKYAAATESVVRTTFLAATGTSVTGFDPATYSTVIDTVVDVQTLFNNRGKSIGFILASPDQFKALAKANVGTANDFVLNRDSGNVSVTGISATLFGIPVKVLPSGTNVFTFTNSGAVNVWESGVGRLTDSNVINLTSAFSLYGYLGCAVVDEDAIVKAVA